MDLSCESESGDVPPDIRGYSHIDNRKQWPTKRQNSKYQHVSLNRATSAQTSTSRFGQYEHHVRPKHNRKVGGGNIFTLGGALLPFLLVVICCTVPVAGQIVRPDDTFSSSAPSTLKPEFDFSHKPILTSLAWVVHQCGRLIGLNLDPVSTTSKFVKRLDEHDTKIVEGCIIPVLVALSGMFAGLTLGYFSVDQTQLQVLSISGTPKQQAYARRIMPIRKDSHLLLTTLILGNMIVNEALPVVMDGVLGGGLPAVVASTALVVIFAEIIPQSVCSRYGLLIGANMAVPVRIMMYIAFPIAWPIAKLLEYILGAHHGIVYRRSELRELIKFHAAGAGGGGDLDFDTVTIAQGALDLAGKTVKEAMTPIDQVFMLPIEAKLDYETLGHVVKSGHSRIPVYQMVEIPEIELTPSVIGVTKTKLVKKVLGSLLVKSCVLLDPEDATPLATIPINAIPSVPYDEPLTNMLNVFQEGRSHMAIVTRRPRQMPSDLQETESVMTAAAGGLRQRFMRKVAEISHGGRSSSSEDGSDSSDESGSEEAAIEKAAKKEKKRRRSMKSRTRTRSTTSASTASREIPSEAQKFKEAKLAEEAKEKDDAKSAARGLSDVAKGVKLSQRDQMVPSDAQMPDSAMEKFFEGLEGAPLGIITLEDVLEELIGEEIYDEYDEHGGPANAASAFVPREAALAARQAALERQKALAQAVPLPATNDVDIEAPIPTLPVNKRTKSNLNFLPKLGLGKRPASNPGRARTVMAPMEEVKPMATVKPKSKSAEVEDLNIPRTETEDRPSTGFFRIESMSPDNPGLRENASLLRDISPLRSSTESAPPVVGSGLGFSRVGTASDGDPAASPEIPVNPLPAISAKHHKALSNSSPVPTVTSPAPLLSEAILVERGRRRLAASSGTSTPIPGSGAHERNTSQPQIQQRSIQFAVPQATSRSASAAGNVPSRSATPSLPVGAKRLGKFKSVPKVSGGVEAGAETKETEAGMEMQQMEKDQQ